jgi:hypothetical protein
VPPTVSSAANDALDQLMANMQGADNDLFQQLTVVGSAPAAEGSIFANFLFSEQAQ